jgi:hypothetical protein
MRAMEHPHGIITGDFHVAFWSGLVCAVLKLLDIYLLVDSFGIVLIKVGITAVVGGFFGVAGKYLFSWLKKLWEQQSIKNKKQ